VETHFLPRNELVVDIGAGTQRLAAVLAQLVQLARLIATAVPGTRQHRATDQLQRGGARLGDRDLDGLRVQYLDAFHAAGLAGLVRVAPLDLGQADIGTTVVSRVVQEGQRKRHVIGSKRRTVTELQPLAQFQRVLQAVLADLPRLGLLGARFALRVQPHQAAEDHLGHVLVPTVTEQVGVENTLRRRNGPDDGVFTCFSLRRDGRRVGCSNQLAGGQCRHGQADKAGSGGKQHDMAAGKWFFHQAFPCFNMAIDCRGGR